MRKIGNNDLCWCQSGIKYKNCHMEFDNKIREFQRKGHKVPPRSIIKTPKQIEGIKESAKINIKILDYIAENIKEGITTEQIDQWVSQTTGNLGGIPAPLNYNGFPKSVCTSINDVVCHGIPSEDAVLRNGDIINVDVSTIFNGYFSDSSRMFCIGETLPEHERLVKIAKECIDIGLEQVRPWKLIGDVGYAINTYAKQHGYTVVRDIGGHGVGLEFHEEPWVSYVSEKDSGMLMVPGMIFTIEPMINQGQEDVFVDENDGWTVYTDDGRPSAQWEIQVLVTENGHEILAY